MIYYHILKCLPIIKITLSRNHVIILYILKDKLYNILTMTCVMKRLLHKVSREVCWSIKHILYTSQKLTIKLINNLQLLFFFPLIKVTELLKKNIYIFDN